MTLDKGWSHPDAECRGMNPALFFADRGEAYSPDAIAACGRCPVRNECLRWAIDHKEHGYWGGTTDRQRSRMRSAELDPTTGHATQLVLSYLHRNAGHEYSADQIARHIDRSESTTRQACRVLHNKGLIQRVRSARRTGHSGGIAIVWRVPADVEVSA